MKTTYKKLITTIVGITGSLVILGMTCNTFADVRFTVSNHTDVPVTIEFNNKGLADSCNVSYDRIDANIQQVIGPRIENYVFLVCQVSDEILFSAPSSSGVASFVYKTKATTNGQYNVIIEENNQKLIVQDQKK